MKKIGEVFSDYKTNSNIIDAEITKMNLIKKTNTLEIGMNSKEYIEIIQPIIDKQTQNHIIEIGDEPYLKAMIGEM